MHSPLTFLENLGTQKSNRVMLEKSKLTIEGPILYRLCGSQNHN